MTTAEHVNDALATWLTAHADATNTAAEWNDLRRQIGTNDATRKEAAKSMPPEEYARLSALCDEVEKAKIHRAAAAERAEKVLNVAREMLQHETATIDREAALINSESVNRNYEAITRNKEAIAIQAESFATQLAATELLKAFEESQREPPVRKATLDPARVYELAPITGIDDDPEF